MPLEPAESYCGGHTVHWDKWTNMGVIILVIGSLSGLTRNLRITDFKNEVSTQGFSV